MHVYYIYIYLHTYKCSKQQVKCIQDSSWKKIFKSCLLVLHWTSIFYTYRGLSLYPEYIYIYTYICAYIYTCKYICKKYVKIDYMNVYLYVYLSIILSIYLSIYLSAINVCWSSSSSSSTNPPWNPGGSSGTRRFRARLLPSPRRPSAGRTAPPPRRPPAAKKSHNWGFQWVKHGETPMVSPWFHHGFTQKNGWYLLNENGFRPRSSWYLMISADLNMA